MKKSVWIFLFITHCMMNMSNEFAFYTLTDSVKNDGFIKINLSPDIISALNENISDIRLYDFQNNEIPYLIKKESFTNKNILFADFPIIKSLHDNKQKVSKLTFSNPGKVLHTEIQLYIRNTNVKKNIILKGSDDLKRWFIISNNLPEIVEGNAIDSLELWKLSIPASNYAYFEITTANKHNDPIQITRVGHLDTEFKNGVYSAVPNPKIVKKESRKKSFITLIYNKKYKIDRFEFKISGPEFYHRNAELGKNEYFDRKSHFQTLGNFQLSSKTPAIWNIETVFADTFILVIDNEDNPSLSITNVYAFQLNTYLIAYLKAGQHYKLCFGNKTTNVPEYDLTYFSDQIPANLKEIKTGKIISVHIENKTIKSTSPFYFNTYILWATILLIGTVLTLITIRLLKDFNT